LAVRERLTTVRDRESAERRAQSAEFDARLGKVDFGGIHRAARDPIFGRYGLSLQIHLKKNYLETAGSTCHILFGDERCQAIDEGRGTDSYFQADIDLDAINCALRKSFVDIAFDDSELRDRGVRHAEVCGRIAQKYAPERALRLAGEYAARHSILPPVPRSPAVSVRGCLNRLKCERWWCRAMRRDYGRLAEDTLRRVGLVHKGASLYVSPEALRSRINRRLTKARLLDHTTVTNDRGQSFSLSDLSARTTSDPVIRRAELMVRVRGLETYANERGHVGYFYVVTLPSRFHCRDWNGAKNPRYHDATVHDGQRWLNRQWQCLRSSLLRKGIVVYGLRTAEPHHDGTPHWNVLMFAQPADADAIAIEFDKYFLLSDSPDEPGACAHRVRRIVMDPEKGDATSYLAKYISKGIDGFRVGIDHEDTERQREAIETCVRVEAWSSIHGVRQFQFFGGPPVTVWRELRRLRRLSLGVIEVARQAAEEPSWASYIRAQGGAQRLTPNRPVRLHTINSESTGLYGDPLGTRIVGVESDDLVEVTRDREWTINWPGTGGTIGFLSSSESCQ
jgi:hypothetical protein